ncbi:MAG: SNF2-related protein [Salinisphaera sp.]|jgi:uncharacterized Zn finger protein|nr:SNF2-related protein [Salinisphaera sp.]
MTDFGRNWWGQQWLAAFDGIDQSNRLQRGRRYANNGSVRSIEIGEKTVKALVSGSRPAPYAVKVTLNPFSRTDHDVILATVENSPVLLSRLLNRQLPAHVSTLLEQRGIRLFPRSWRDMTARCSCPDDAMPCKHIAAVIYLLANEIDKNPFVVFSLHGMDLAAVLAQRSGVQPASLAQLPVLAQAWSDEPQVTRAQAPTHDVFDAIDLSRVPALESRIFTILSAEPLFHAKDFRQLLAAQYKRVRRQAEVFDRDVDVLGAGVELLSEARAVIDDNGALVEMRANDKRVFKAVQRKRAPDPLEQFLACLHGLPADRESRLSHSLRLWRTLLRFALKLIEQGAYVPQAAANSAEQTLVQWRPARLAKPIRELFDSLCGLCPPDFVQLQRKADGQRGYYYADAPTQVLAALHVLLAFFVRRGFESTAEARAPDPIKQLFFSGRAVRFDQFETHETPRLIAHWLRRLTLGERAHRLHLMVDERSNDEMGVSLAVEDDHGFTEVADWLAAAGPNRDHSGDNSEARSAVLADLAVLADYFPDVERLYDNHLAPDDNHATLIYSLHEFTPVFREVLPALRMLGIGVMLPKALQKLVRPQASLSLSSDDSSEGVSYLNLDRLLDFDWQVAIGDARVSAKEFQRLVKDASGLVRIFDQYVMVDQREVAQVLDKLAAPPTELSRVDLLQAGLTGELDGAQVTTQDDARELFDQLIRPESPPPVPATLHAELRPYQKRGYEWLAQNGRLGFGSLLADDMGLGKTIQVIALLAHLKEAGRLDESKALVVVPTSLLSNWRHEIERFAPSLTVQIFHGVDRRLALEEHDVILTSYGLVRSDSKTLAKPRWALLALDEAQNIKNPKAAQTKAVKRLQADIRIGLSGTPVENRLREYWSVFDFINPKYLSSQKRFAEVFANPIERDRDQAALDRFRAITAPFILRRLKTDKSIIADLPDKIESNHYCALTPRQASLYQNTVSTIMDELDKTAEGIERRGIIFKLLNALKQICNSPAQFGRQKTAQIEESGKLAAFVDIMREVDAADEKALIFTQYRTMGALLTTALRDELGLEVPFLHGGLTRKKRDAMVEDFQNNQGARAMVLSLKAGGTGLNLTAASQVIHYDLWWNPAVERQATDRAYRIGQHRNVVVHRLITENTFEEKIDEMIQSKKELADLTVASGEQWISEMSDSQLQELVSL